jgi:hypothetical protein
MERKIPVEAIRQLVDYLHYERKDYESETDPERRSKHIYNSVAAVRSWLVVGAVD